MPTILVLIRHAEASCGLRRVVGGIGSDTGLTPAGREQAGALHDRLQRTGELAKATCLVSSLLPRALETAETIAPAVGSSNVEPAGDYDLCELDPGEADGLTMPEFESRFGQPDWGRDPALPFAPGGDSLISFFERATGGLRRLVETRPEQMVVAVTHGAVIKASLAGFLGFRFGADGVNPKWCSMTWWSYERDMRPSWRLDRYNDTAHLLRQPARLAGSRRHQQTRARFKVDAAERAR